MTEPFPNFLRVLNAATEDALREFIARFGVIVPVIVDQHGNVQAHRRPVRRVG